MPLIILGLIAVGAAILLIYYSMNPAGRTPHTGEIGRRSPVREKHYETSEDGKVVYLYDREKKTDGQTAPDGNRGSDAEPSADGDNGNDNDNDSDEAGGNAVPKRGRGTRSGKKPEDSDTTQGTAGGRGNDEMDGAKEGGDADLTDN
jgi:hypothetical protein